MKDCQTQKSADNQRNGTWLRRDQSQCFGGDNFIPCCGWVQLIPKKILVRVGTGRPARVVKLSGQARLGNIAETGSIWKMPAGGGPEEQLVTSLYRYNFAVASRGIYYMAAQEMTRRHQ
jgi:hypothetical protein